MAENQPKDRLYVQAYTGVNIKNKQQLILFPFFYFLHLFRIVTNFIKILLMSFTHDLDLYV